MSDNQFTTFTNCSYCLDGALVDDHLVISEETGRILKRTGYIGGEIVDLEGNIIAPGFLELHANGVNGFHYTHWESAQQYEKKLAETAGFYVSQGVTGFWATIPTVSAETFQKILPSLTPRSFPNAATLHGAHVEGPYLASSKAGAHNATLFHTPSSAPDPSTIYGTTAFHASNPIVKLATVAPELPGADRLIKDLSSRGVKVSLGHSAASYEEGLAGLKAGATCLTHTLNAMAPLQSRAPGLAGLISLPAQATGTTIIDAPQPPPFFALIPDSHHLAPATLSLLHNAAPSRALLITDGIELASPLIPAGLYPGHGQIAAQQRKLTHDPSTGAPFPGGPKAVIAGTDTLIGGCVALQQGVRNLVAWSGCSLPQAVRTVTENVARFMGVDGVDGVGLLREGRRADLCVLSEEGEVLQTWSRAGRCGNGRAVYWPHVGGYPAVVDR